MFYFNCNIKTEVYFEHYNMDLICKDAEIFKRLTKKVESYCDREFGYIIEVIKNTKTHSESGIIVENTRIAADGCYVHVKFNCITFKRTCHPIFSFKRIDNANLCLRSLRNSNNRQNWQG